MALSKRGNSVYFYQSVRIGQRVTGRYGGKGETALRLAREADRRRVAEANRRAAAQGAIARLDRVDRQVRLAVDRIGPAIHNALIHSGWQWRKNRVWARSRGVVVSAYDDARKAESARRMFASAQDAMALIERLGGKLSSRIRDRLVEHLSPDATVREGIRIESEDLRRRLEGPSPSVIETLIIDRVVLMWLHISWLDLLAAGLVNDLDNREVAAHVSRLRNAASRNYVSLIRSLDLLRRGTPHIEVNMTKHIVIEKQSRKQAAGRLDIAGKN